MWTCKIRILNSRWRLLSSELRRKREGQKTGVVRGHGQVLALYKVIYLIFFWETVNIFQHVSSLARNCPGLLWPCRFRLRHHPPELQSLLCLLVTDRCLAVELVWQNHQGKLRSSCHLQCCLGVWASCTKALDPALKLLKWRYTQTARYAVTFKTWDQKEPEPPRRWSCLSPSSV